MGDVVFLNVDTRLPIPVERVCDGAKELETVLILGFTKEGQFTAAASDADLILAADMCQRFLAKLYRGDYNSAYPTRR